MLEGQHEQTRVIAAGGTRSGLDDLVRRGAGAAVSAGQGEPTPA